MLRITAWSIRRDLDLALAWIRLHEINPGDCQEVRIYPWLRIAAFKMLDRDRNGKPFLVTGWYTGLWWVSYSWRLRRLRVPPAFEWCEGGS